ncbi:hypothetical protein RND81_10G153900 [Saponaria officinalis]|uniref:Uncharacterized protein n=1 Tax=Saponaria officinalis TaxID=3572 RepID=A0AAW1I3M9_SAPOF
MHVSSLTTPLTLDQNFNSDSYYSSIDNQNINSQFNSDFSYFPSFNWEFLVQFLITALILGLGFLHLLRSTASKYFAVDSPEFSVSAAMSATAVDVAGEKEGCAVCGEPTKLRCSACKTIYYCSQICQRKHWMSEHRTNCKGSSGRLKSQQNKVEKPNSSIALVPSVPQKPVDKVLFSYDEFVKLFNCDLPTSPPCGLLNCGNSCFANVVLQCLAHTRPLVAYLLEKGHRRDCRRNEWCFLCELEALMDRARKSQQPFSPINILSRLPSMGGNMGHGRQEDAHEFMRFAIDMMQSVCLDEHGGEKIILPKSQETTLIQHIFGGQLRSQVKCTGCNQVSNRYENMMDLTVEIQGDATSLQECLDQFTETEWLNGENKYKCDTCKDYVIACKRLTIHQAPNILTVTLKRFQGGNFGKINKKVTFPECLDLSPYMSEERDGTDKYELYAVVVHVDMLNASFFGHYICYTKCFKGDWYWIDDCKVTKVELDEVLSQGAYMLLYKRISARTNCLKTCDIAMNKEHGDDKMVDVVDDSCSSQLATCSTSSDPVTPLSIVDHEPMDRESDVSHTDTAHPSSDQPSECKPSELASECSGACLVAQEDSEDRSEEEHVIGDARISVVASVDQTDACDWSDDGSVDFPDGRSGKKKKAE